MLATEQSKADSTRRFLRWLIALALVSCISLYGYPLVSRWLGYARASSILNIEPTPEAFDNFIVDRMVLGASRQQVHAEASQIGNVEFYGWFGAFVDGKPSSLKCETAYFYLDGLPMPIRALKTWQAYDFCYMLSGDGSAMLAYIKRRVS